MKANKYFINIIDTAGQNTAVITGEICRLKKIDISQTIMKDRNIEQVAFLNRSNGKYDRMEMMGDELSINGSLACSSLIMKRQKKNNLYLKISGISIPIRFKCQSDKITAYYPQSILINKNDNIIKLKGIGYLIKQRVENNDLQNLIKLTKTYKLPASGIIYYKGNKINPLIYVQKTNSLIYESACGSGSLAFFIYSGINNIIQPSNKTIEIGTLGNYFTIKLKVKILK